MKKQIYLTMLAACLCVLTTAQTVIPSYVPTNGLVGWWPFNGNANDLSGNNNNGTVNGATLTADRYGNANKAYNFNGINNYIEAPSNTGLQLSAAYSIGLWFKSNIFNAGQYGYTLISKIQSSGWYGGYETMIGETNSIGGVNHTGNINGNFQLPYSGLSSGNWYSVIVTFNGTQLKLYVNGNIVNTVNQSGTLQTGNDPLRFGRRGGGGIYDQWFNGVIDDIGIWNRALTECEVKKLYTSGSFSVSSSASNTICVGQSLNLSAAGANSYTWSTGATSQSISVSPTVSTVYTVSTTYSAGCTDSRTFNVTVNVCTGLNETEFATNSVRIFPNPAKEQLNISLNNIALIGKNYTITNALGQVMATGVFNKQTMELTIQQFSSGLYQLNIDGLQENYKFIKE
jgi:hypothetical protein